ncbi:MAG: energy-coupling factor transporter transmembrane protein EcfT [Anaerolineae bacterium]|nr:MAG: energy-coupling factor transporter transmembrane protein EcfT [Anaerolineae bacterium]
MLVTWKYRERNTFLQSLDPRARWLTSFLVLFAIVPIWHPYIMAAYFVLAMVQYFMSGLTWAEMRRVWFFVILLVVVIIGINAIVFGRGGPGEIDRMVPHVLWEKTLNIFGWRPTINLTVEKFAFAATQMMRMLGTAVLFFIIPWTIDPSKYGVTFAGMGIPYKFAFSMDLAFRFVPTLARDFFTTMDAQKARGYEVERVEGGVITQIRRIAPLLVPVVMNAILDGEDITNAMDLRSFGQDRRTWIGKLKYRTRDYVWIGIGVLVFAACLYINWGLNIEEFFVPDWFYALFGVVP